eukprot:augustus_masked-scaffold_64-processed-gene-0.14-mRNA-1 protein AED:0.44 eAED:0.44 QI:0/0/0/1/1/1/2/0/990
MIRRPLGETYHPVEGEVVLHMDFLKVKDSYLLVILEDISRKILLVEDPSPCAAVVVKVLVTWRGLIGLPARFTLVSDNGSHFNNEVLRQFESRFPSEHKFSIVYSPWSNGSIEVMNRFVLRVLRQLCSCSMLDKDKWKEVLHQVVDIINNSRSRHGFSPNELTSYLARAKGIHTLSSDKEDDVLPIVIQGKLRECRDPEKFRRNVDKLLEIILSRRNKVEPAIKESRDRSRKYINKKFRSSKVNFAPGDFVLISRIGIPWLSDKISLRWIGPYLVVGVEGEHCYKVKSLEGKLEVVHSQRITLYQPRPQDFKISSEVKHSFYYNQGPYKVNKFIDLRSTVEGLELLVWWKGFPKSYANWQSFERLFEDVPKLVKKYINPRRNDSVEEVNAVEESMSGIPRDKWLKGRYKIVKYPARMRAMDEGIIGNLSRAKGWSDKEIFESLNMLFGIGCWGKICGVGCLPGNTKSQMVTLLQIESASQSIGEYSGLKVPFRVIKDFNDARSGVFRRGGMIVRRGRERSREEVNKEREFVRKQFEDCQVRGVINIPVLEFEEILNPRLSLSDLKSMIHFIEKSPENKIYNQVVNHFEEREPGSCRPRKYFKAKIGDKWHRVLLDSGAGISCIGQNMISNDQIQVKGDRMDKLNGVYGVSGKKLHILGYVEREVRLVHPLYKYNLGKVCLYVLGRDMRKIIIGEKVLRRFKLRPEDVLFGRGISNHVEICNVEEDAKDRCLSKWKEMYVKEINKRNDREKYRKVFGKYLEECGYEVEGDKVGDSSDNLIRVRDLGKVGEEYFVVWKQPKNSRYMVANLLELNLKIVGQFDVILLDPAWRDGVSNNPTRGLNISYPTLNVEEIKKIPVPEICPKGVIALWVTNSKVQEGMDILKCWGAELVEVLVWIKKTRSGKLWNSHGPYVRHNKEILLLAVKGKPLLAPSRSGDVIISRVRQQSRKPDEIYQILERLDPEARYLEMFGRRWNCREGWNTIGLDASYSF